VLKTTPPVSSTFRRRISSWVCSATRMASGSSSHGRVEPSTSLKRKVSVALSVSTALVSGMSTLFEDEDSSARYGCLGQPTSLLWVLPRRGVLGRSAVRSPG